MKNIAHYIDATYLKTAKENKQTKEQNLKEVIDFVNIVLPLGVKCIMIRPSYVKDIKNKIIVEKYKTNVGTVIDFPLGESEVAKKIKKAQKAINNGADELDFVVNYNAFLKGNIALIKEEVSLCTKLVLQHKKTIKWIVETAALNDTQIIQICSIIKNTITSFCKESDFENIFIKSSTGYYKSSNYTPTGATYNNIIIMLENSAPLMVKASGGIKNLESAQHFINLGVKRIGTSAVYNILNHQNQEIDY
jgi:deoxyribose-phosphate aldolase